MSDGTMMKRLRQLRGWLDTIADVLIVILFVYVLRYWPKDDDRRNTDDE